MPAERIDDSVDGALTSVGHRHADHSASGMTDNTPLRIAATAWDAVIDSLKQSGARTMFIAGALSRIAAGRGQRTGVSSSLVFKLPGVAERCHQRSPPNTTTQLVILGTGERPAPVGAIATPSKYRWAKLCTAGPRASRRPAEPPPWRQRSFSMKHVVLIAVRAIETDRGATEPGLASRYQVGCGPLRAPISDGGWR